MLRLRFERLKRGWSQYYLAALLGWPQNTISLIERGERLPTTEELETLARALDFSSPHILLKETLLVDEQVAS
jgi:transcriptional regulator with XRE-family HTH domain